MNIDGSRFEPGLDTFWDCPFPFPLHLTAQRCVGSSNLQASITFHSMLVFAGMHYSVSPSAQK